MLLLPSRPEPGGSQKMLSLPNVKEQFRLCQGLAQSLSEEGHIMKSKHVYDKVIVVGMDDLMS
jgi:hypothetical protein